MRNHIDSKEKSQDLSSGSQNRQKQGIEGRSLTWDSKMIDPKRPKEQETEGSGETQRFEDGVVEISGALEQTVTGTTAQSSHWKKEARAFALGSWPHHWRITPRGVCFSSSHSTHATGAETSLSQRHREPKECWR